MATASVLWTSAELASAEHLTLETHDAGASLSGTTVLVFDSRPAHIRFVLNVDSEWRTTDVNVDVFGHRRATIDMRVDERGWTVNGVARSDLVDCVDVDLGWTPATNTLPIRRLGLDVGESAEITAAWLQFPELVVVASRQRYVRMGNTTWRYLSGQSDFVLETTADGIVMTYGDDLWIASSVSTI